jgi:hypothetical protein
MRAQGEKGGRAEGEVCSLDEPDEPDPLVPRVGEWMSGLVSQVATASREANLECRGPSSRAPALTRCI